jgi:hypothetical protein
MKFLCIECDRQMTFEERELPGDGTLAIAFACPGCGRRVGMLTNPFETQLVSSLGVVIGGRTVPEQPMEMVRSTVATGKETAFGESKAAEPGGTGVTWSSDALERLAKVPNFVRGMVKRIYADYARERGITEITPTLMDTARTDLGLEGL